MGRVASVRRSFQKILTEGSGKKAERTFPFKHTVVFKPIEQRPCLSSSRSIALLNPRQREINQRRPNPRRLRAQVQLRLAVASYRSTGSARRKEGVSPSEREGGEAFGKFRGDGGERGRGGMGGGEEDVAPVEVAVLHVDTSSTSTARSRRQVAEEQGGKRTSNPHPSSACERVETTCSTTLAASTHNRSLYVSRSEPALERMRRA
jgi:hypothetical protein